MPLVGWPFNAGGYTVRWVFEATVQRLEWLVGHRSTVVFSNALLLVPAHVAGFNPCICLCLTV